MTRLAVFWNMGRVDGLNTSLASLGNSKESIMKSLDEAVAEQHNAESREKIVPCLV
jgi:hypothetical protein